MNEDGLSKHALKDKIRNKLYSVGRDDVSRMSVEIAEVDLTNSTSQARWPYTA